jgi:hypothetical protein
MLEAVRVRSFVKALSAVGRPVTPVHGILVAVRVRSFVNPLRLTAVCELWTHAGTVAAAVLYPWLVTQASVANPV